MDSNAGVIGRPGRTKSFSKIEYALLIGAALYVGVALYAVGAVAYHYGRNYYIAAPETGSSLDSSSEKSFEDLRIEKLQMYVKCLNKTQSAYEKAIFQYAKWCTKKCWENGPSGKEKEIAQGIANIEQDPTECINIFRKTALKSPKLQEADQAARDYADVLEKLHPLLREASVYYWNEEYKADGGNHAKVLHKQLLKLVAAFFPAKTSLIENTDQKQILQTLAENLDKNSAALLFVDFFGTANQQIGILNGLNIDDVVETAVIQKLRVLLDQTRSNWKKLEEIQKNDPQRLENEFMGNITYVIRMMRIYNTSLEALINAMEMPNNKELRHKHLEHFSEGYDRLVDGYNETDYRNESDPITH